MNANLPCIEPKENQQQIKKLLTLRDDPKNEIEKTTMK